jgi:hypothetical protein
MSRLAFLTMAVLALYLPKITEGISNIIVKKIRGKK